MIYFDVLYEDGSEENYHADCFAPLARENQRQKYSFGYPKNIKSILFFDHEDESDDWVDYIMYMPFVQEHVEYYEEYCSLYGDTLPAYEVSADVDPHHLLVLLTICRYPLTNPWNVNLWEELVRLEVHPDVAFYISMIGYKFGEVALHLYRGLQEYALISEEYLSWKGLKTFVEKTVNNDHNLSYFEEGVTSYNEHKTYSRGGYYPVAGWLHGYKKVSYTKQELADKGDPLYEYGIALEELADMLKAVQKTFNLREVTL